MSGELKPDSVCALGTCSSKEVSCLEENIETIAKVITFLSIESHHEKTCFMPYANNKGADQISAFVIRCPDSIISILAKSKILTV